MNNEFELFKNTTYQDLLEEIFVNSRSKKDQIDIMISELKKLVKTVEDARLIVPLIKDCLEVGVKNDDQLVKLANIIQKLKALENVATNGSNQLLTDEEKKEILNSIQDINIEIKSPNIKK